MVKPQNFWTAAQVQALESNSGDFQSVWAKQCFVATTNDNDADLDA